MLALKRALSVNPSWLRQEWILMLPSSCLMNRASPHKFSGLYLASLTLAEQEESVVRARSTLGALVAGIVGVGESQQAELLINIL